MKRKTKVVLITSILIAIILGIMVVAIVINNNPEVNWDKILNKANEKPEKYLHDEQQESEYIGIGTDGKSVNMDLWDVYEQDDGYSLDGYLGEIDDGKILGTVPQYIYCHEKSKFEPVIILDSTFEENEELEEAPEIPNTVKELRYTFAECTNLRKTPLIPEGVILMEDTFEDCTSLTEITNIPSGIITMEYTFARLHISS